MLFPKKIIKKKYTGFTLMEVLVSMSIFVVFTLAILGINGNVLHSSQKTLAANKIQQEAQLIMQSLAKKIRTSRVNYNYAEYLDGINDSEQELALIDLSGTEYIFFLDDDSIKIKNKQEGASEYTSPKAIPTSQVLVTGLNFIIEPKTFPFSIDEPPLTQPRVTMVIKFSSSHGNQTSNVTVQQTVPQLSGGIPE
ncbi:MAG: prepilin-type N-terminal cleavage/methylation domain-containing protein [Patescibacteria group bacterium]